MFVGIFIFCNRAFEQGNLDLQRCINAYNIRYYYISEADRLTQVYISDGGRFVQVYLPDIRLHTLPVRLDREHFPLPLHEGVPGAVSGVCDLVT